MMKKIKLFIVILFTMSKVDAQQNTAEQFAQKISQKMKDTLTLSEVQKQHIYDINMQIHSQKLQVRQLFTLQDSLQIHLQKIENKRDSMYHTILPDDKYQLYKQKKRALLNNN